MQIIKLLIIVTKNMFLYANNQIFDYNHKKHVFCMKIIKLLITITKIMFLYENNQIIDYNF